MRNKLSYLYQSGLNHGVIELKVEGRKLNEKAATSHSVVNICSPERLVLGENRVKSAVNACDHYKEK